MIDDSLSRAARALRESHDGASAGAAITRARVLERAWLLKRRRRATALVLWPLGAALTLSTAWAAVHLGQMAEIVALLRGAPLAAHHVVTLPFSAPGDATDAGCEDAPTGDGSAGEGSGGDTVQTVPPAAILQVGKRSPVRRAAAPSAELAEEAGADDSLYAEAHRAHFVARDPAAALRAWDAYLAAAPNGRFAIEARYNRALSLLRLGRLPEARAALAPFAEGTLGGYRQGEARTLLAAMDGGS